MFSLLNVHACMACQVFICLHIMCNNGIVTARKRSLRRLCFYRCLSVHKGGRAWLLGGGMRGCSRGACVAALGRGGMRGCSGGGMHGCSGGACMAALGGRAWLLPGGACVVALGGACVVALGGCVWLLRGRAWLLWGGVRGCSRGGMCGSSGGGVRGFFHEIRSMSGRYASYWNAFLFNLCLLEV